MPSRSQRHMTQMGRPTSGGVLPITLGIYFTGFQAAENIGAGAALGTLSTLGTTGTATFTLTNSDGNRVALSGTNNVNVVRGATAWDYETKPIVTFTVSVAGVTPTIPPTSFSMVAMNVLETVLAALTLSASTVPEGSPANTVVGAIQGRTAGSTITLTNNGNERFAISGTNLVTTSIPTDYEGATSHSVTIRETHADAAPRDTTLTVNVTNVLEGSLNALTLSANTILENSTTGTTVGSLLGVTPGSTLSLTDSASNRFALSGSSIVAGSASTNFEAATSHSITVRETLTDAGNSPRDTVLTIDVTDVLDTTTLAALTLSASTVAEDATIGATVGAVVGKTASSTLSLTDNAGGKFALSGTNIVTAAALDYETATSHSITIRETLAGATNTPRDTVLTVTVTDVTEAGPPTLAALTLSANTIVENSTAGVVVGTLQGKTASSTLLFTDNAGNRFALSGTNVVAGIVATDYETATSHSITVQETLAGATNTPRSTTLTINVGDITDTIGPFTLAWTSADTELVNPTFTLTPSLLEGDSITIYFDNNNPVTTPFTQDTNVISHTEATDGSITFPGITTPLPTGVPTYCFAYIVRGAIDADTNTVFKTLVSDTTAPALSSPTGTATGPTTATLTVSTDEANGTLYAVASTSTPGFAQIKLGQNSTGAASSYAFNQPVTTTGVQTKNATGLTPSTTYRMHYYQEDTALNGSNVATVAAPFTTDAAGGVGTTWDPAFAHANHTLSNGDKTMTAPTTGSNLIRTVHGGVDGGVNKVYWEIEVESTTANDYNLAIGIAGSGAVNIDPMGGGGWSAGLTNGGSVLGLTVGTGFSFTTGDVLQFALDMSLATGTLAIAKNGGSYTTFESGGITNISPLYPAVATAYYTGASVTIRSTSSEWSYSPPSGFVEIPTA